MHSAHNEMLDEMSYQLSTEISCDTNMIRAQIEWEFLDRRRANE